VDELNKEKRHLSV